MEKLNKKLILEFLEDTDVKDVDLDELNIEEPIQEPIEVVKQEEPEVQELSEPEKLNFIVSTLTDLSQRVLDLFNYLTPLINNDLPTFNISQENKDLLNSIYEDVSLVLGKVQQGIKNNCVDNIQDAIDDGQTQVQETAIQSEKSLKEDINKNDSEREDIVGECIDEYFRDYFAESPFETNGLKQYTYDILDPRSHDDDFYKDTRDIFNTIQYFIDNYENFYGLIKLFYRSVEKYKKEILSLCKTIYNKLSNSMSGDYDVKLNDME